MTARVLVVRPLSASDADLAALAAGGFDVTHDPYLVVASCTDEDAAPRAHRLLARLGPGAWLVLASAAGARALADLAGAEQARAALVGATAAGTRFAAVGPASAEALLALGAGAVVVPRAPHTASGLLAMLADEAPARVLVPRSAVADSVIPATLASRGWQVHAETLYETTPVSVRPATAAALARGDFDVVILRSPSAARALHGFVPRLPDSVLVVAGGPTTALASARLGLTVAAVAPDSTPSAIADTVAAALAVAA